MEELKGVNSQVCEQLFKKLNSHKKCKSLSEARFFMFFIYNIDIHNLSIEHMYSLADPRGEMRWTNLKKEKGDCESLEKPEAVAFLSGFKNLSLEPKFQCDLCGNGYSNRGYLESHLKEKHHLDMSSVM